jgi:phytoene desaturase
VKKIAIIGSGFSGISAACYLAKAGNQVVVFEKNESIGGRARKFEKKGFVFDMGPSWYWMPDVFENFYNDFGYKTADFYELIKLDPGFQIIYDQEDILEVHADFEKIKKVFEDLEPGSAQKLEAFINEAAEKYAISMNSIVFKPSYSIIEYISLEIVQKIWNVDFFIPLRKSLAKYFKEEKLLKLMEFPVLFLGAMADKIPALYSIMNYAALKQGTFYPQGGMHLIVSAFEKIATQLGVTFKCNTPIEHIEFEGNIAKGIVSNGVFEAFDGVISSADYHHTESKLLPKNLQNYDEAYWDKKVFAPSSLLFYLGIDKKIDRLKHHNLFFDSDFEQHSHEIYTTPKWPTDPLYYVCCPSKTDPSVAPEGCENIFILIPIAAGLEDTQALRDEYFEKIISRLERFCNTSIKDSIVYKRDYCKNDFVMDYNSYKGNAYGLANTLFQTAFFKPKLKNNNVKNLFYTGQLTVPGPGVPPSIISGKIAATELIKNL